MGIQNPRKKEKKKKGGCYSERDSQGLPGCSNPRILEISTIIFPLKLYTLEVKYTDLVVRQTFSTYLGG